MTKILVHLLVISVLITPIKSQAVSFENSFMSEALPPNEVKTYQIEKDGLKCTIVVSTFKIALVKIKRTSQMIPMRVGKVNTYTTTYSSRRVVREGTATKPSISCIKN